MTKRGTGERRERERVDSTAIIYICIYIFTIFIRNMQEKKNFGNAEIIAICLDETPQEYTTMDDGDDGVADYTHDDVKKLEPTLYNKTLQLNIFLYSYRSNSNLVLAEEIILYYV